MAKQYKVVQLSLGKDEINGAHHVDVIEEDSVVLHYEAKQDLYRGAMEIALNRYAEQGWSFERAFECWGVCYLIFRK